MSKHQRGISRREFLKGAAAGAASIAAAGMFPAGAADAAEVTETSSIPAWLGEAPDISDDEIAESFETDIIVIGGGIAGVAAVREAAEQGVKVALFEKCETLQARSGDFGVLNSEAGEQYEMNNQDVPAILDDLMRDCLYRNDYRMLKYWAEHSGEDFDWYLNAVPDLVKLDRIDTPEPEGAEFWLQPERYPLPEKFNNDDEYFRCYQVTMRIYPSHQPVMDANYEAAKDTGNVTNEYFYTPVVKLLTDDTGRVTGVIAQNAENGEYIKGSAAKGVILATGDYSGNTDMLHYYCPWTDGIMAIFTSRDYEGNAANTGDGHRMGMQIGAKMESGPHGPMIHHMGGPMGVAPYLQLNANGERFMNEDCPGQQLENQLENQPGQYTWQFFDGAWKEQIPYMPAGHGCACYVLEDGVITSGEVNSTLTHKDGFAYQEQIDSYVEQGTTLKADSIEELIALTGMPEETALASIERYNELARNGYDEDFNKVSTRLFEIAEPPFYAAKLEPSALLVCMGGLQSDWNCHVYDEEMNIIPGLYVAGNVMGNRFKVEYPTTVPGISHSICLSEGRHAASVCIEES